MSWRATAFVKTLTHHKDGTPLTAREKLILFVLADSHNDDYECAWPGLTRAARQSLTSRRRLIELLKRLEEKGTILIERREGKSNLYRFPALSTIPVQSSHPPSTIPVQPLHGGGAIATALGGAIATAPKPLISLNVSAIQPVEAGISPPEAKKLLEDYYHRKETRNYYRDVDGKPYLISPSSRQKVYQEEKPSW